MTAATQGLELRTGSQRLRAAVELVSSMRFAISLLTVICIASVIGTIVKQHEPVVNYVNQFGPFWAELFMALKLNAVYSAGWFLLILAFLVISTSLCIARNTPKIIRDLKAYKENVREEALRAFHHRAEAELAGPAQAGATRLGESLAKAGWKVKLQRRATARGEGWMVAAKRGGANKVGYLAAHSAIVLVCLGGLMDGDLIVRAQMWFGGKTPYAGGGMISDVKPEHRLPASNPTFRGNLFVAEGTQSGSAVLNQSDGILIQELPFSIELKKFIVEHYSTGMPKLFASEIVIHDRETGAATPARVEVNHPARYRGIEIYQSSFDDGGSSVKLKAVPINGGRPFEVEGVIGGSSQLTRGPVDGAEKMTLEYTGLRVINVENFSGGERGGTDVRAVDLRASLDARLGAANKTTAKKELRNIGPSISYKLRDAAGQAREFNNYMLPVDMGDGPVFLMGLRETPSEPFRYLRVPADDQGALDGFVRLRAALQDPAVRAQAIRRYAAKVTDASRPELAQQLTASASRALDMFAGEGTPPGPGGKPAAGLQAISDFMEANVPEAERARAGEVLLRILSGVLFEMTQITREQAGLKLLEPSEQTQAFMTQAMLALSDANAYPVPMAFQLVDFKQVQASVFQVTRGPGKNIVYLGCALLILGVFAMLYVRERRVWCWVTGEGERSRCTMALSSNRKTMDADREFELLRQQLLGDKVSGDKV
ncbi:cytochrome c biogenesis protein ResB [Ramlibacter solisilvae]|uniref:Cytochrome C biogenesis protein ResB n=1 Tax=Ramlibacter tataouinensis TaxID=94132 RepID=A0A127JV45_9BURK|nr:cytochrome c biogenesis protein ResB [Ramlibacter tataouinensis]AMO23749.1 cytochrome C biogenesis protein ResB [Ramlibacter tataouinensis]